MESKKVVYLYMILFIVKHTLPLVTALVNYQQLLACSIFMLAFSIS